MNDYPESTAEMEEDQPAPTQAQLYDDLRRIGQLEDQKHAIQTEIEERTDRLRSAMKHLDQTSLLYQMLSAALAPPSAPAKSAPANPPRRAAKKTATAKKTVAKKKTSSGTK